ncbi:hypothetical protein KHA80_00175 [Anaerobacillus sp. HL2]|nr:hypothetical protein KHA80_00175 [Anaerobacillus sp. HL2]
MAKGALYYFAVFFQSLQHSLCTASLELLLLIMLRGGLFGEVLLFDKGIKNKSSVNRRVSIAPQLKKSKLKRK